MRSSVGLLAAGVVGFLAVLGPASEGHAATAFFSGAFITRVQQDISAVRGPGGRATITIDRHFPLAGVCLYAGTIDGPTGWALEFPVEHPAYKSLLALALTAYANGRAVDIEYDDAFGAGTTCRITGLAITN